MEKLPAWLQSRYEILVATFGRLQTQTFSWSEAVETLKIPEGTAGDVLSRLERFGYLFKEVDAIDRRMRSYRLVDVTEARDLDSRLETWRQGVARTSPPLAQAIDRAWAQCRAVLDREADLSATPDQPGRLVMEYAAGKIRRSDLSIFKKAKLEHLEKDSQSRASSIIILKLFDASSNTYRSITNVLLEYEKLHHDMEAGNYDLSVGEYASIDGMPMKPPGRILNKMLCPICRRFRQSHTALALITGGPKNDSVFETYRRSQSKRSQNVKICSYCFLAGFVDLPIAKITKVGQGIDKGCEYLFITTPLDRDDLERLLAFISRQNLDSKQGDEEGDGTVYDEQLTTEKIDETEDTEDLSANAIGQFLQDKYGIEGFDNLAVLGVSTRRLQELRGLVLPSANALQRVVAVRVPVERLVGEDKVSGAVRREMVKATMYDFWQITGGSLHYNRIVANTPFSLEGRPIDLEEMRRANLAYRIANRYARVGKYRQLSSGLFMLLLARPRGAANQILRAKRRESRGRYAPGAEKVKEIIEMVEELAYPDDWKFRLGLQIAELLVSIELAPRAGGFWYKDKETRDYKLYSGVDLVKWIQRIKMVRDSDSARAWGTGLINGYRREHDGQGPNTETVGRILALVEEIIQKCQIQSYPLKNFARDIANMDYYLLFYYNQRQAAQLEHKRCGEMSSPKNRENRGEMSRVE